MQKDENQGVFNRLAVGSIPTEPRNSDVLEEDFSVRIRYKPFRRSEQVLWYPLFASETT